MLQFILYSIIFACLMFIWTYVYLNKSKNKINQSFLFFLFLVMIWMVLNESSHFVEKSLFGLLIKTIYWYSMLNLSIFFLLFVYRLTSRKLDTIFYIIVSVNSLTILSRYCFPMDYADPTFWRLTLPIVAPVMSFVFSIPAIFALYLMAAQYKRTIERHVRRQLLYVFMGIAMALIISVVSEYVLPTWFNIHENTLMMYVAIFVLVLYLFQSIMRNKFLSLSSVYVYEKLLANVCDGIMIVNKRLRIVSVNEIALKFLHNTSIRVGDKVTDYIEGYSFGTNYDKHEITLHKNDQDIHLLLTQYPLETDDPDSGKLLTITDITTQKESLQKEKEELIEKTYIDSLTGLFNKQHFFDSCCNVTEELDGKNAALMFIDIDDFKTINDTYGHMNGDMILKKLADHMKDSIGDNGKAFRFGGDEFVVVLMDTKENDAYLTSEKIRLGASQLEFPQISGPLHLSLSIGLIEGPASFDEMIRKADIAMYASKSKGKNQTTIFSCENL